MTPQGGNKGRLEGVSAEPGLSWWFIGKEFTCNAGDLGLIPGLGKIPWRRERLPIPVTWPGVFHGLYRPWGRKESDTTERFHFSNSYVETLTAIMTVFGGGR